MGKREKNGIMGLNQRIIFTSHPKRRKHEASHFHQEFPSQNVEKAGEKVKEERKASVGIAPALPGNRSGSPREHCGIQQGRNHSKVPELGKATGAFQARPIPLGAD